MDITIDFDRIETLMGVSSAEMAEILFPKLGGPRQAYSKLRQTPNKITLEMLGSLCTNLSCSLDELISVDGIQSSELDITTYRIFNDYLVMVNHKTRAYSIHQIGKDEVLYEEQFVYDDKTTVTDFLREVKQKLQNELLWKLK